MTPSPSPSTAAQCNSATRAERHDVSFGAAGLDIYPTTVRCNAPVVMFVHGGGYCCGNKSQISSRVISWLNGQGYTFVAADYSLRVTYPVFDNDVAAAIAWVRSHAGSFGADGSRIALMGHSTGASMVAEVGTTPRVWANTGITTNALRCVVVLDASSLDLVGMMANPPSNASAALIRRVYTADSNTWRAASAFENANDRNNVAKWFIAERGGQQSVQRDFAARLRANGSSVQEVDAGSLNHGQVLNNFGSANDHIMTAPMATFLRDCLA